MGADSRRDLRRPTQRFRSVRTRKIGPYDVVAAVGKGASGEALLAVQRSPDFRKVAVLKALRSQLEGDATAVEAFLDEARLSSRLQHPNVVQTFGVILSDDRYFLAMEYLEGVPLDRLLGRLARKGDAVPERLAAFVAAEILEGLDYAHHLRDYDGRRLGIVHRDVSPANLFLCWDGSVKLLDFGIAKVAASQTDSGVIHGKFAYMAPEQAHGSVDARADVFSLGVILYEMLTGSRLRPDGNDVRTLERLEPDLDGLRPTMEHISDGMADVVRKALSPLEDRYADARAMADGLACLGERPPSKEDFAAFVGDLFVGERQAQQALLGDSLAHLEAHRISSRPPITPERSTPASGRFPLLLFAAALVLIAWVLLGPS